MNGVLIFISIKAFHQVAWRPSLGLQLIVDCLKSVELLKSAGRLNEVTE